MNSQTFPNLSVIPFKLLVMKTSQLLVIISKCVRINVEFCDWYSLIRFSLIILFKYYVTMLHFPCGIINIHSFRVKKVLVPKQLNNVLLLLTEYFLVSYLHKYTKNYFTIFRIFLNINTYSYHNDSQFTQNVKSYLHFYIVRVLQYIWE